MTGDQARAVKWEVSAVRVCALPDGWWQAVIYWRGAQPPLYYGPLCREKGEALGYAQAVRDWLETPDRHDRYIVWDGCVWVIRPARPDPSPPKPAAE